MDHENFRCKIYMIDLQIIKFNNTGWNDILT